MEGAADQRQTISIISPQVLQPLGSVDAQGVVDSLLDGGSVVGNGVLVVPDCAVGFSAVAAKYYDRDRVASIG